MKMTYRNTLYRFSGNIKQTFSEAPSHNVKTLLATGFFVKTIFGKKHEPSLDTISYGFYPDFRIFEVHTRNRETSWLNRNQKSNVIRFVRARNIHVPIFRPNF